MNNHGSIRLAVVYRVGGVGIIPVSYAIRDWLITSTHTHVALSGIKLAGNLEEARAIIKSDDPDAVNIRANMDDPDNVVETWVLPWGDDVRVPQVEEDTGIPAAWKGTR